jgi:hypothetical protein
MKSQNSRPQINVFFALDTLDVVREKDMFLQRITYKIFSNSVKY